MMPLPEESAVYRPGAEAVALMLKVEAEFDLTLPQPEITPENFQSVKSLEQMILHQLVPAAG